MMKIVSSLPLILVDLSVLDIIAFVFCVASLDEVNSEFLETSAQTLTKSSAMQSYVFQT
jgi:hypothetical protein